MCVIIAKKFDGKYCLYKIRDRNYNPTYKIFTNTRNNTTALFVKDIKNDWIEGVNEYKIKVVSSALTNHFDELSPDERSVYFKKINARNGLILRRALYRDNIDDVVKVLVDAKFIGNTFVTDGNKLVVLEISIPPEKFDYESKDNLEDLSYSNFIIKVMNNLKEEDFKISIKEIKSPYYVKTNHSTIRKNLGYTPDDKGYESSIKRKQYVEELCRSYEGDKVDFIYALYRLKNIDKNPENCPIRSKEKTEFDKKDKKKLNITSYYTTDIFGLIGTNIFHLPLYSKNLNKFSGNNKVNYIKLNKKDSLLESIIKKIRKEK